MSPKAAAAFARRTLAEGIRSRNPYLVHTILVGYDKEEGPYLTFMDYMGKFRKNSSVKIGKICSSILGSQFEAPYLLHGYGGYFCYSILDRLYRPDLNKEEAIDLLKKCLSEIRKRFIINLPNFQVIIIDKEGYHQLENITV